MFASAQTEQDATSTPSTSSVIQQDIFVRGGPGRDYLPVGKLLAGDRVRPLSRNVQGDWILIVYGKGYGWIRRDLAFWIESIDTLPIIDSANLTPSPIIPTTPASTPILAATETPVGNWVQLDDEAQSGYVRAGPGRTYLRLGQLYTGDVVEPVSQNADGSWVMIRFEDGFGWIARNLVRWIDDLTVLPIILDRDLTPTATFTATYTPSPTLTATYTPTPTSTLTPTQTLTHTSTSTLTPSATSSPTVTPSATLTNTATATTTYTSIPTLVPTETLVPATSVPTKTPTDLPTATLLPTVEPTVAITVSFTPSPSNTLVIPTATDALQLTATMTFTLVSLVPSVTVTKAPSRTNTAIYTSTAIPSTATHTSIPPTHTPRATFTQSPTITPTTDDVLQNTNIPTTVVSTGTATVLGLQPTQSLVGPANITPTQTPPLRQEQVDSNLPIEALIAGFLLFLIVVYGFFYWRGLNTSERYAEGFVIDRCSVCGTGRLVVEARQERVLGIPRARRSVRCTDCRSVLREVNDGQWRYAVDPSANPQLYQQFNGKLVSDNMLIELAEHAFDKRTGTSASTFNDQ